MRELLRRMSEEIALLQVVAHLLEREGEILAQRLYSELPELTRRKEKVADRLAACDADRKKLLVAMGHADDRAGADAAAALGGPVLQQAWARLQELATRVRALNHGNGVMVHAHLDFTRQSIAFLQTGGRPLYGPNGQHSAGGAHGLRYAAG